MADTWVQRTAEDFAQVIEAELPTGGAWPRDRDGDLMRWVDGCAQIWGDVSAKAALLLTVESDPRETILLMPEWERAFGLPDVCDSEAQTLETRRAALINKLTIEGAQSRAFFIGLAAALGYDVSIYEYLPYQCGISQCGDTRPAGELTFEYAHCGVAECGVSYHCDITLGGSDDWVWRCGPPELRYYWRMEIRNNRLTWLRAGVGEVGADHHCEFGLATDLECVVRRWKPAHTYVLFDYSQVLADPGDVLPNPTPFSDAFSDAFAT